MSEQILNREWEEVNLSPEKQEVEQQIFWEELGHAPKPEPSIEEQLTMIRQQLQEIIPAREGGEQPPPVVIEGLPPKSDTPSGELREKDMKRKQKEAKERQPKSYREKLLVVSDLQLLSETNEEGVGALIDFMKDQGKSFTHIVLNGDIIDFRQQSGFRDDNQLGDSVTIDEQVAGRWFIEQVEKYFPDAKKVFMMGNHEARYENMYKDTTNGVAQYLRPFEEVFGLEDWEVHPYGQGHSYDWHGRKIKHGHKGGAKTNVPKIMTEENLRPNTVGHIITNRMWETVDGDGNSIRSYVHAGFSGPAHYDKSGDPKPSNGFGIYYYDKVKGREVTTEYQVIFPANHSRFISPDGKLYDGVGYNLRQEIGLDPKPTRRGRPRK